ncbi:uncharacterized protein [Ptychodera flava]|uniref:uncharacterized protein n=1 Tax=Ptychodera flava TaxID=63121 RepID=UPI00396A66D6
MSKVREKYWIPKLRSIVKSIRHECSYCVKYRAKVLDAQAISALPTYRTEFTEPFDVTGRALQKFEELEEVLLDVETFMNNRPLCYTEEDFEQLVITPNLLLRGQPARFLEESIDDMDDSRDERYSKRIEAKDRELPRKNSIILLKDTTKNRANWKIGRIVDNIVGKDGVIRGYKIRTGSGYVVERPLQLVCDLEVSGTNDATGIGSIAEPEADPVINQTRTSADEEERDQTNQELRRPARRAKTAAVDRLVGVIANENEDD